MKTINNKCICSKKIKDLEKRIMELERVAIGVEQLWNMVKPGA